MTTRRAVNIFRKYHVASILFVAFLAVVCGYVVIITFEDNSVVNLKLNLATTLPTPAYTTEIIISKDTFTTSELRAALIKQKLQRISKSFGESRNLTVSRPSKHPNYNIHIFYYTWYSNKEVDGINHHWNFYDNPIPTQASAKTVTGFYPKLGCYSSKDPIVLKTHFKQIRNAGIGVIFLWWSPYNQSLHRMMENLLNLAGHYKLKIALHVKAYKTRTVKSLFRELEVFIKQYTSHPAYYKIKSNEGELPVFYIYQPYLLDSKDWKEYFDERSNTTIRKTIYDGKYFGLLTEKQHINHLRRSKFDGVYTFYASNGNTYGSTWKNWDKISKLSAKYGLMFSPTVAPGYIDPDVQTYDERLTKERGRGHYYDIAWRVAINNAKIISINSFNDWHTGTQIEPAASAVVKGVHYKGYEPDAPDLFLNLTKWWVDQFEKFQT